MARFKPAGSKKTPAANSARGLVPCAFIILLGFAVVFWLFYEVLKSGK
jgi:hypothetical protein